MNRTITATHSHVRSNHPAFAWPQSFVVDVTSLNEEFGIRRQTSTSRFRGEGLENDDAPVIFTPVFTPPRRRLRMHTEKIVALVGGLVAVVLITCTFWLMITHSKGAANGTVAPAIKRELRLFEDDTAASKLK